MKLSSALLLSAVLAAAPAHGFLKPQALSPRTASRHVLHQIIFDSPEPHHRPPERGGNSGKWPEKKNRRVGEPDDLNPSPIRDSIISGGPKLYGADAEDTKGDSEEGTNVDPDMVKSGEQLDLSYIRNTIMPGKTSTSVNAQSSARRSSDANSNTSQWTAGKKDYSDQERLLNGADIRGAIMDAGATSFKAPARAPPTVGTPPMNKGTEPPQSTPAPPAPEQAAPRKQLSAEERENLDYAIQIESLASLLSETEQKMAEMKVVASRIQEMELADPSLGALPAEAEGLKSVLAYAKAAMEVHGPNSPEALEAWKDVEECAAGQESSTGAKATSSKYRYSAAAIKAHHYYNAAVDSEFLQEAITALDIINNLSRFVKFENDRISKMQ